jgi:hypothetical protein
VTPRASRNEIASGMRPRNTPKITDASSTKKSTYSAARVQSPALIASCAFVYVDTAASAQVASERTRRPSVSE